MEETKAYNAWYPFYVWVTGIVITSIAFIVIQEGEDSLLSRLPDGMDLKFLLVIFVGYLTFFLPLLILFYLCFLVVTKAKIKYIAGKFIFWIVGLTFCFIIALSSKKAKDGFNPNLFIASAFSVAFTISAFVYPLKSRTKKKEVVYEWPAD